MGNGVNLAQVQWFLDASTGHKQTRLLCDTHLYACEGMLSGAAEAVLEEDMFCCDEGRATKIKREMSPLSQSDSWFNQICSPGVAGRHFA